MKLILLTLFCVTFACFVNASKVQNVKIRDRVYTDIVCTDGHKITCHNEHVNEEYICACGDDSYHIDAKDLAPNSFFYPKFKSINAAKKIASLWCAKN